MRCWVLEKDIERKMARAFEGRGAIAWKFVSPGRQGVPDRIVLMPGGKVAFVELKTETGKLSPMQKVVQEQLRGLGFDVYTVYGAQQAMELANTLMGGEADAV